MTNMMLSPEERKYEIENNSLAPYAAFSSQTRGRQYPIAEHPLRTVFQRDRDRVIHSAAFRRMEYKTQVFVNHEGDHYRTRLTHTIEVAQISRTIARSLGLNEDLAEAIALVHDLGHTPFGHSGEDVLNELLADHGGFNHNQQSLRVVDYLERRYPDYPGLNLTYEVREGIAKHETALAEPINPAEFPPGEKPTLEAALVDLADAIAYNSHDIDDGLSSGLINWDDLDDVTLWAEAREAIRRAWPDLEPKYRRYSLVREIVNRQVTDLINRTYDNIVNNRIETLADIRRAAVPLVAFSDTIRTRVEQLKGFLKDKMYRHPHLNENTLMARGIIETLFSRYRKYPEQLHGKYKLRLGGEPVEHIIRDFIAGMTDRYAVRMYDRLK